MINKKIILNDFQLKTIVNCCRDLNVINIIKTIDYDTGSTIYVGIYELNGVIFTRPVLDQSLSLFKNDYISLLCKAFQALLFDDLCKVNDFLFLNNESYSMTTYLIFDRVMYELCSYYKMNLSEKSPYVFEEEVYHFVYQIRETICDPLEAFCKCMDRFQPNWGKKFFTM